MNQSDVPQCYFITSKLNGFVLGVSDNSDVVNQPRKYPPNLAQQWYLKENGGFMTIVSRLNGHVATIQGLVKGENVTASPDHNGDNQRWSFSLSAPTYITSAKNGSVFDVCENKQEPDTPIIAYRAKPYYWNYANQQFQFEKVLHVAAYVIKCHLNGYVLDLSTQGDVNGAVVLVSSEKSPSRASQMWYLDHQPDGSLLVVSALHGRVLDCGKGYTQTKLKVWKRHGGTNQRWRIDGDYLVSAMSSGYVMDIEGGGALPGGSLILWTRNNPPSASQYFTFVKEPSIASQKALCNVHEALCDVQKPSCDMQEASYDVQKPSCDMQEASCDVQKPSCDMQEASCAAQEASYDVTQVNINADLIGKELQVVKQQWLRAEERAMKAEHQTMLLKQRVREAETKCLAVEKQLQTTGQISTPAWKIDRDEIQILTDEQLGVGGWGIVCVAKFRGLRVAAKCLHASIISAHNLALFSREISLSASVRHPNLLLFIGACVEGQPIILTELMPTSLRTVLGQRSLSHCQVTSLSTDVAMGLNYLHLMRPDPVIHRDISSANVLLEPTDQDSWRAKVSDFGSANFLRAVHTVAPGSYIYAAPEHISPERQSPKMDVYSFGILLLEMITGQFPDNVMMDVLLRTLVWESAVDVIRGCIEHEPASRPAMSKVIESLPQLFGESTPNE